MPSADKPRVFIVDDEKPIGRVLLAGLGSRLFDGDSRFEVIVESDSRAALERLCTAELFDVIFLDIIMPHMNGMMFYSSLKLRAPARCHRVIFITGGGLIPAVEKFLEKHHHIEKPFTIAELTAVVDIYAEKKTSRGPV